MIAHAHPRKPVGFDLAGFANTLLAHWPMPAPEPPPVDYRFAAVALACEIAHRDPAWATRAANLRAIADQVRARGEHTAGAQYEHAAVLIETTAAELWGEPGAEEVAA